MMQEVQCQCFYGPMDNIVDLDREQFLKSIWLSIMESDANAPHYTKTLEDCKEGLGVMNVS